MTHPLAYREHAEQLYAAVAFACSRLALDPTEKEELQQGVELKLLEDDCAVLRRFRGKATLKTYLSTVVLNVARDYRIRKWGKFRPTARAQREGSVAVRLEILTARDGWGVEEAIEYLIRTEKVQLGSAELSELAGRIDCQPRRPMPAAVELDQLASRGAADAVEGRLRRRDADRTAAQVEEAMKQGLADMAAEDRLVLKLFYCNGLTAAQVARTLGTQPRSIYSRLERLKRDLRGSLERAGHSWARVKEIVGDPERELSFDFDLPVQPTDPTEKAVSKTAPETTRESSIDDGRDAESPDQDWLSEDLSDGTGEG